MSEEEEKCHRGTCVGRWLATYKVCLLGRGMAPLIPNSVPLPLSSCTLGIIMTVTKSLRLEGINFVNLVHFTYPDLLFRWHKKSRLTALMSMFCVSLRNVGRQVSRM